MNDTAGKKNRGKRPYVRPLVTRIKLTSEEVVLGACKASVGIAGSKSPGFPCSVCGQASGS